jgi:hypothetical protein
MSVYQINKLCHRTLNYLDFRAAMQRDPAQAIEAFDVTPEERAAVLAGDVATLCEMGVHPCLMSVLTRYEISGLTPAVYSERIRKARDPWVSNADPESPHLCGP